MPQAAGNILTPEDARRIGEAVTAAEALTDGEIVTVVAEESDPYRDAALQWSVLAMLLSIAALATFPDFYLPLIERVFLGGWHPEWTPSQLLTTTLLIATVQFLVARLILTWRPLRLLLVPGSTKTRRVHRRALALFRVGIEQRTGSRTGVLLYLSLAEHRAEIVADAAIHAKVAPEAWGEAMAVLLDGIKAGRAGDGMVAAVDRIGAVLAEHFPRTGTDPDELPDRLILL